MHHRNIANSIVNAKHNLLRAEINCNVSGLIDFIG